MTGPSPVRAIARGVLIGLLFLAVLLCVWEGAKALGGDPWRFKDASGAETVYTPPFSWPIASDLSLPHVWKIAEALGAPVQRQQQESLAGYLVGAALYTGREAALGFLFGGLLGLALAAAFVHSKLAERAFMPYVLGGVGFARITPTAQFTYTSGQLPDGTTPTVGADVTTTLATAGDFTQPAATTALMFTLGGGVEIPVTRHWDVDAGYRYSRVATDTPVNVQGATFGVGYRFR